MQSKIEVYIDSDERFPDFSISAFKQGEVVSLSSKLCKIPITRYRAYIKTQKAYNRMQKKLEELYDLPSENK